MCEGSLWGEFVALWVLLRGKSTAVDGGKGLGGGVAGDRSA